MAWKSIIQSGDFWQPQNEGDAVEGVFKTKELEVGRNKSSVYHLEQEDGKVIKVWGSTVIDRAFEDIKEGDQVRIEFQGTKDIGRPSPLKLYDVQVWSE